MLQTQQYTAISSSKRAQWKTTVLKEKKKRPTKIIWIFVAYLYTNTGRYIESRSICELFVIKLKCFWSVSVFSIFTCYIYCLHWFNCYTFPYYIFHDAFFSKRYWRFSRFCILFLFFSLPDIRNDQNYCIIGIIKQFIIIIFIPYWPQLVCIDLVCCIFRFFFFYLAICKEK